MREFDLFVIGGGSGGVRAARVAAAHGARVALAECHRLGGTCVIRGCVPKKLMVLASRFAQEFEEAAGFGWHLDTPRFNWPTLKQRRDAEIARLEAVYGTALIEAGVTVLHDHARFVDGHTVQLRSSGETIRAGHILIATGGRPWLARLPGLEHVSTSNDLFEWPRQPQQVVIQGGGYIAVEFACLLQRLGSRVTLVYRGERILRGFDGELRDRLQVQMAEDGIEIVTGATVVSVEAVGGAKLVSLSNGRTITADEVLFATGRVPNTAGLDLQAAGVTCDAQGAVLVNVYSCSNVPSVHAVGDVTNRVNLTPVAIREGHAFADTVFGGKPTAVDHALVPTAVFTTPEIGTVGLTEEAALAVHPRLDVYRSDFRPMKATLSGHRHRVFMKLLVDPESDRVLGCHMMGPDAAEMAQLLAIPLRMKARKTDFDATLAVHPTAAEEWVTLRKPAVRHGAS
jgi:glutathione reductase (NADPH)